MSSLRRRVWGIRATHVFERKLTARRLLQYSRRGRLDTLGTHRGRGGLVVPPINAPSVLIFDEHDMRDDTMFQDSKNYQPPDRRDMLVSVNRVDRRSSRE